MSDKKFERARINKANPTKMDAGEQWEVTFPIDIIPENCPFPSDLARNINGLWEEKEGRHSGSSRVTLCGAEINGSSVTFTIIKSEVQSLEGSIREFEKDLQSQVREYISKTAREETSENELNIVLDRISKSER
jgi:hypothetical protein